MNWGLYSPINTQEIFSAIVTLSTTNNKGKSLQELGAGQLAQTLCTYLSIYQDFPSFKS